MGADHRDASHQLCLETAGWLKCPPRCQLPEEKFQPRTCRPSESDARWCGWGAQSDLPPGSARKLTSREATRPLGRMNQSSAGDGVASLLSQAGTHQVIHIRRPEHPPHCPLAIQGRRAALGPAEVARRSLAGVPKGRVPRSGGGRTVRAGAEGIPPPRSRGAPRLDAAPRPPWLRIASASPDSRRNPSAESGKSQRQMRSPPRVCRSAGPRELRVDARGAKEASGWRRAERRGQLRRPHPAGSEGARCAAPPPRSVPGLAIRPLYSSPRRGGARGERGVGRRGAELLSGRCSSVFLGTTQSRCRNGSGPLVTAVLSCNPFSARSPTPLGLGWSLCVRWVAPSP